MTESKRTEAALSAAKAELEKARTAATNAALEAAAVAEVESTTSEEIIAAQASLSLCAGAVRRLERKVSEAEAGHASAVRAEKEARLSELAARHSWAERKARYQAIATKTAEALASLAPLAEAYARQLALDSTESLEAADLAAQLGVPSPVAPFAPGMAQAVCLDFFGDKPIPNLSHVRHIPEQQPRAHTIAQAFAATSPAGMTVEQLAAHLLAHGDAQDLLDREQALIAERRRDFAQAERARSDAAAKGLAATMRAQNDGWQQRYGAS